MAIETQPNAQAFNLKYGASLDPVITAENGDLVMGWHVVVIPVIKVVNELTKPSENGQILIGSETDNCLVKAVPTGSNGILVTAGPGTLNFSLALTGGDLTVTSGVPSLTTAAKMRYAQSAVIDLVTGAQDVPIFCPNVAATLQAAYLIYQTASGTIATTVSIGKPGSSAYYLNAEPTLTGQAQWAKQPLTLLENDTVANDTVFCTVAGGSADAGKVMVVVAYTV